MLHGREQRHNRQEKLEQAGIKNHHSILSVVDHPRYLFYRQTDVDRVHDGAHGRYRQIRLHVRRVVPAEGGDPVAATDTEGRECACQALGLICHIAIRRPVRLLAIENPDPAFREDRRTMLHDHAHSHGHVHHCRLHRTRSFLTSGRARLPPLLPAEQGHRIPAPWRNPSPPCPGSTGYRHPRRLLQAARRRSTGKNPDW